MPLRGYSVALIAIGLLVFGVLAIILWLGVPVLYMDDWTVIPLLQKIHSGKVGFIDFWATYNEHRIFLPRLFYVAIYGFLGLNPQPLMWLSWFIMGSSTVIACLQLFLRDGARSGVVWKNIYAIAFAAVLLSLVQYENWLWAFELQIFVTQAFVLGVSVLLATELGFYVKLFGIGICAIGASCSSGQGILLWPAALVGLLAIARTGRHRVIALGFCAVGFLFFAWQYRADPGGLSRASPFTWALHRPNDFVGAFFALTGSPFTYWAGHRRLLLAPIVGFLVLVSLSLKVLSVGKCGQVRTAAHFFVLAIFGLLFCFLVTLGRAPQRYNKWFLTSRYTTHALLIPAGILGLSWVVRCSGSADSAFNLLPLGNHVFLAFLCILIVGGTSGAISLAMDDSKARQFSQHLIPLVNEIDPIVDGVMTGPYYPLCPVDNSKLIEWGIRPAIAGGLLKQEHVNRSVTSIAELHMDCETKPHARQYLGHPIYAPLFSGSLAVPKGCQPDVLLIRRNNGIVLAAPLQLLSRRTESTDLYQWALPVSPSMKPAGFSQAEVMLYAWRHDQTLWKIEP